MKVQFTETVLRDANQSLIATRMPLSEFKPILGKLDEAGYYSLECWGGATFDSCLRYLGEDPWERLRTIREACPNTKLQMLLRGQNLLGYKHYPDDVVRKFVRKSVENGIDIIRIFDALNDLRNIEVAVDETLKAGAHASGTICFTISPIHTLDAYVKMAREMEKMGVRSICIKDMAGIMGPQEGYDLVKALKENVKVPIVVHTHCTTGLGPLTLQKAVEAGADVIDTAISCFSGGTAQPATETLADGAVRMLPFEQQSPEMQEVLRRGCDAYVRERHETMQNALRQVLEATKANSRQNKFYFGVLNEIYRVNLLFFNGCHDLSTLADEDDRTEFGLYIDNQDFIRGNISKRMTTAGQKQLAALWDQHD